jgi:hypothetical protein
MCGSPQISIGPGRQGSGSSSVLLQTQDQFYLTPWEAQPFGDFLNGNFLPRKRQHPMAPFQRKPCVAGWKGQLENSLFHFAHVRRESVIARHLNVGDLAYRL